MALSWDIQQPFHNISGVRNPAVTTRIALTLYCTYLSGLKLIRKVDFGDPGK